MIKLDEIEMQSLLAAAHLLADAAAVETLHWFRSCDLSADNKGAIGFDPVTQADKAAERAMRDVLARLRPDDGILGEEEEDIPSKNGLNWVLDPIDGTRGYLSGTPTWGTLIGVNQGAEPILGMIDQPYIGERFWGSGQRATLRHRGMEKPLTTRRTASLDQAILFSTFPEIGRDQDFQGFSQVAPRCKLVRYGTDCYAYGLLAAGQIDLVIEAGLHPYDIQGPMGVITAAGGIVTNWAGGSCAQGGQVIAAANRDIHAAALALLGDYADG